MRDSYQPERRACQRVPIRIPVRLFISDAPTETPLEAASVNMCVNGVYCVVNRYLPVFDRLLITLVTPGNTGNPAHVLSQLEAIVVRVEPEQEEVATKEYAVALFFQDLSEQQKQALDALMQSHSEIGN